MVRCSFAVGMLGHELVTTGSVLRRVTGDQVMKRLRMSMEANNWLFNLKKDHRSIQLVGMGS